MKLIASREIELVVMGSLLRPLAWYREQFSGFIYEPPRPHRDVLRLMQTCDVLVLPRSSKAARSSNRRQWRAPPLDRDKKCRGDDLIEEGETGFLVPIRAPEAIAEKINWCATNRASIPGMAIAAQRRASELTWHGYGEKVVAAIRSLTGE